jgi:hypothetical protein
MQPFLFGKTNTNEQLTDVNVFYHVEFKEKHKAKERGMKWDNEQKLWYFSFTRKSNNINVDDIFNMMNNDEDTYFKFKVVKVRCIKMNREDINKFERLCNNKFIEMFNKQNNKKQKS